MLKVKMLPPLWYFEKEESGIKRVVEAYYKYLPEFDIELVEGKHTPCDLLVSHAGTVKDPDVVHTHGLYWSADYQCNKSELHTNSQVIEAIRNAEEVTVPSRWVQKTFERDMRFKPHIIGHGIEAEEWEHDYKFQKYVLWNKNRKMDVCSPEPIAPLALAYLDVKFVTTFAPSTETQNIEEIGVVQHSKMKKLIQKAGVYLSTTKETFGIGILEAMAAGVPVLGYDYGGNSEIVEHGVTGYLAQPGNEEDLKKGLSYCMENRTVLGENGKKLVKQYSWREACRKVSEIYHQAYDKKNPSVSVVVPAYNYAEKMGRAIESAINQEFEPEKVIIVDDGSTDNTPEKAKEIVQEHKRKQAEDPEYNQKTVIEYIQKKNGGVATARNAGIEASMSKYVCCLDADDKIAPEFLHVCVNALEDDRALGIAYTGLHYIKPDGEEGLSSWPGKWDFDKQLQRQNQVPTCNVMRKKMLDRLGGYRQRYAPQGAGSEDAELWLRVGAYGWKAEKVDNRGLFIYSWLSGRVSGNPDYHEVDWMGWHPWTRDQKHPFASYATPQNNISHSVRQYDEPVISVIIPVGPGHGEVLLDALDSLEAQSYRRWEAIVVFDSPEKVDYYNRVYPYIETVINDSGSPKGAGWARNRGVEKAKGSLLLFLDADDWLQPAALDTMLYEWEKYEGIVYSDYAAKGKMSEEDSENFGGRLLHFDSKKEEGVVSFRSMDYDCERAQIQPQDPDKPYIWNLITSLVPIRYHDEIGGFDEEMESWEDWDYWIRMAKAGKCFNRIPEELVIYRFYTGTRRARGREIGNDLVQYLKKKYKGVERMGCNCGKLAKKKAQAKLATSRNSIQTRSELSMDDKDYLLCRYEHGNRGQHRVYGGATNEFYGYHGAGAEFYVHKKDIAAQPRTFVPITIKDPTPKKPIEETAPPEPIEEEVGDTTKDVGKSKAEAKIKKSGIDKKDLTEIPGISDRIAKEMNAMGIHSWADLMSHKVTDLMDIKGVGEATATKIFEHIMKRV